MAGVTLATALVLLSCGREPTGPQGNAGVVRSQGLAWIAQFPEGLAQFQAAGGSGVAFTKVRVVLNNPDGSVALDTLIDFPPGATEIQATLSVILPASAPASGQPLTMNLDYLNASGASVFHGGPVIVTAVPAVPGAGPPPPSPVVIPISYVGPGAGATKVVITPKIATVAMGGGFSFSAQAFNGTTPLANTPIIFNIGNGALGSINASTGSGTTGSVRGSTTITAQLLTGPTDVATLNVTPIASAIALVSGSGQTGPVSTTLANPLVVRVTAPDGLPVAGVAVSFAASNGGTTAGAATDASGLASTTWKLGNFVGAQSAVASAAGAGSVNFAATGKPADPAKLEFVTQPPGAVASGAVFGTSVRVLDASNQLTPDFTGLVTLSAAGGGGSLLGSASVSAVGGVATFSGLRITVPGTYTLTATSSSPAGPIAPATSSSVVVNPGAVTSLQFSAYPGGSTAGAALGQVTVSVRDSAGNVATNYAGAVALTVGVGPSGGGLLGTTTVNAVAGIATFSSLQINIAGSYALRATANGVSVTGSTFSVSPGVATGLQIAGGAGQTGPGSAALPTPVSVKVTDAFGNGVGGATVTFAPTGGSGSVVPTSAVSSSAGLVQTVWTLGPVAGPMTLNVASTGLAPNPLTIAATASSGAAAGPATKLLFTTAPGAVAATSAITPAMVVTAKDAGNLTATSFTGSVTLQIAVNPGAGTLSGTVTVPAVAGVATFPGISINNPGVGYRLQATATGLSPDTTAAFNVGGGAIVSTVFTTHLDSLYSFGDFVTRVPVSRDATTAVVAGTYTYVSRSPATATVSAAGLITAVANGSTYVVATEAGGTKDSTLVVVQQRIATVNIAPGNRNIYKTRTFQFAATPVDGRGNAMAGAVTWSTVTPSIASVNATGLVTAAALGVTQLRATIGAIIGTANVTVLTPITRIVVGKDSTGLPSSDTTSMTSLGIRRTMRAQARDTLDVPMAGVTFTWSSTNSSVALIDTAYATTSAVLSNANGTTAIQAIADGITGSSSLRVAQLLASIDLSPTPDTIGITGTVQLTARGKDANNRYISGGSFTFASGNAPVATVNAATGVVSGVALGTANVTATSGAITSNNAVIVVATTVPPRISFGRDTLSVGRGSATSIPIFLSRPNGSNVTVNLAARDTNAYFSVGSVTFTVGQTALNVTLNGRNAGTTLIYATDGSATGFNGDTATVAVQANMRFAQTGWSLNATDQVASQVLLSDPSPAGGTFVTFNYGTPGRATVSPDPAFIPAGQLASNVVITALGTTNGSTTITPVATGVNGTASTMNVSAPVLTISAGASGILGSGQYENGWYVYTPAYTVNPIPLTFTSTDPTKVTVTPATGAIPAGSYYQYFTVSGIATGTAKVIVSAAGWTPDTLQIVVSSPRTIICCGTTLNTTSPVTSLTVYATDSVGTVHYRTSSLALSISSSDTNVIRIIDQSPVVSAGAYSATGIRYQPGGAGGTAYVKVVAGGHRTDSVLVTVVGPKLEFSWGGTSKIGKGQFDQNLYVYSPNNVVSPLTVTLGNAKPTKATVPATVTIPAGSYYAYFSLAGLDTTGVDSVSIIASAPGYQGDTSYYKVTSPRVTVSGGGTFNAYRPPTGVTVYSTDSVGNAHYRNSPLAVTWTSRDTSVIKVDSGTVSIATGQYYNSNARVSFFNTGSTYLVASAAGHRPDSVLYTVITPKLNFSFGTALIGRRQEFGVNAFYVYTPDNRTTPLAVTFTQTNAAADSLSSTSLSIPTGLYYQYFTAAGRAVGVDTIIATAPGYLPDTAIIRVSSPRVTASGLPSSALTTSPPSTVTIYATDSVGTAHYAMDTVVFRVTSSDTTVIKPTLKYVRIPKGQYYVTAGFSYFGPGAASLTITDSAGTGYGAVTTNTVTVTGPSLLFSTSNVMYGMRQRGASTDIYVYTQNNVATPVTVNLISSAPVVATVPASVTIPGGSYYAYFTVTAQDTVGTIQIQANAVGFGPPTPITVQVTQPKFVISTSTTLRTTQAPQNVTIYATDANGAAHYVTENVTVNIASSSGSVFTVDSASVTIAAGTYYNNAARWTPVAPGTAQFSATDPRAAIYKYNTTNSNFSVVYPTLSFSWTNAVLGLGQYIDISYDGSYYIQTPDNQSAPLPVTLTHIGTARATTLASVTVPASLYYAYIRLTGAVRGTDSLVATASSPFHNADTAYTVVDSGRVDGILSWPASVAVGDSVLVTLRTLDPNLSAVRRVVAATTFTLAPNAKIQFRQGGVVVTSVTVPADGSQVTFYVKALASGAGAATITHANYKTYSPPGITIP